jgi:uncharacterized protein (DUF488 family)
MDLIQTVGHGAVSAAQLGDLLAGSGVGMVVDVRRYPGSRRHPHFNRGDLARWLPERGIGYRWEERLGGRRRGSADSVNAGLLNLQFRAYADHMASDAFRAAVGELLGVASAGSVAVMCSESLWWRCHRRLLADHLVLVERVAVEHLLHTGRSSPHSVTAAARRHEDRVVYEPIEPTLPEGW